MHPHAQREWSAIQSEMRTNGNKLPTSWQQERMIRAHAKDREARTQRVIDAIHDAGAMRRDCVSDETLAHLEAAVAAYRQEAM